MKKVLLLAGLCLCLVSTTIRAAHADTITTFTLTGTAGSFTALGSFTVDTTTGVVQSTDFNFTGNTVTVRFPFDPAGDVDYLAAPYSSIYLSATFGGIGKGYAAVDLDVPVASFIGYTGGAICSIDNPCLAGNSTILHDLHGTDFQNGQLTPTSVLITASAPEPSSLSYLLLSIAAVASLPFLRRRILQPCV